MRASLRIGRIAGIEIGVHFTWIFIFILVASSLALGFFGASLANESVTIQWLAGIAAALLLFVSVLLHELAHSLVAQAKGIPVRSITLFIFGGVSNLEEEPQKASTEFIMAIVGPLTSLGLALVFWAFYAAVQPGASFAFPRASYNSIAAACLHYLAYVNTLLAAFNILPGFPLDGGRVLRSIIWGATGNVVRATNVAATVGRLFGWALIAMGILMVFGLVNMPLIGNGLIAGLWMAFIGWFLSSAAETSRREVSVREYLSGVKVKDAMVQNQTSVTPGTTLAELVQGVFNQRYRRAVPVCDENGRNLGIVSIADIKGLPQDMWSITPVERIMKRQPLYWVAPEDDLNHAMSLITQNDLNQLLVIDQGRCIGVLTRAEIIAYLQLAQEIRLKAKHQGPFTDS